MRIRSLQSRIIAFFVVLLGVVLASAFVLVTVANSDAARADVDDQLAAGARLFARVLQQNKRQLEQAASVISSDFAFRKAIASNDLRTVDSVLRNHGARINADVMMLIALDEPVVLADTHELGVVPRPFPFRELLAAAEQDGLASDIVQMRDGKLYQLVIVTVVAPAPVARVAMGFVIDDRLASELQQMTGLYTSFLAHAPAGAWQVVASTLPGRARRELAGAIPRRPEEHATVELTLADVDYQTRLVPLGDPHSGVTASLQRSLSEALAPFHALRTKLTVLAVLSLAISVFASVLIARRITRPVNALAAIAGKIQQGDYSQAAAVEHEDEIGALAASFNHMREGIAAREREVLRLAYQDTLTGLPNRALFNDRLGMAIKVARRTSTSACVLMMDLDRFKFVNDTLGHHAGDRVLKMVGERLQNIVRDSDTVARLGGDEFALLLPGVSQELALPMAMKILKVLELPIMLDAQSIDVATSIGIAEYPLHGEDGGALMRHADVAMYAAKRAKSGFAVYDARYDEHRQEHLSLLSELRHAVLHDELRLYYQPKIDLASGRVTGVEALVRWHHPERGVIAPSEFIPFAEQTGYIKTLTRWVLDNAIRQCGEWRSRGISLNVAINISPRDLLNRELPDCLATALSEAAVPAEAVCLEITESALMEDPQHAEETLSRLRAIGVRISIDDYGTGFSSLAYLQRLSVNELKIDRTFIMNMAERAEDSAIVRSTIELGHNLGLSVVAEGVESARELDLLRSFACDAAQGFWISKPLDVLDLELWLAQPHAWAPLPVETREARVPAMRLAVERMHVG